MQRLEFRRAQLTWRTPQVWPKSLCLPRAGISSRPHQLESRMREIRPSGLEGGVAPQAPSLPLSRSPKGARATTEVMGGESEGDMSRVGKIARLPREIREELNRRL